MIPDASRKVRTHPLALAYRALGRYALHYLGSVLCQFVSYLTFGVGFAWAIRLFTEAVTAGNRGSIIGAASVMLGNGLVMSLSVLIGVYLSFFSTAKVAEPPHEHRP